MKNQFKELKIVTQFYVSIRFCCCLTHYWENLDQMQAWIVIIDPQNYKLSVTCHIIDPQNNKLSVTCHIGTFGRLKIHQNMTKQNQICLCLK